MPMPNTSVATNLNETTNIKVNLFPKFTLNLILPVNDLSKTINLALRKVTRLSLSIDTGLSQNPPAQGRADAIDIL
jgi:hypothetical protein